MTSEESTAPPSIPAVQSLIADGTFEDSLSALEAIVAHLERGRLSIDESVTWYELGLGLSRRCADLLQQAELRISTVENQYATGPASGGRWDDDGDQADSH
jgi:exodeoxyribonuclease VII small subunit